MLDDDHDTWIVMQTVLSDLTVYKAKIKRISFRNWRLIITLKYKGFPFMYGSYHKSKKKAIEMTTWEAKVAAFKLATDLRINTETVRIKLEQSFHYEPVKRSKHVLFIKCIGAVTVNMHCKYCDYELDIRRVAYYKQLLNPALARAIMKAYCIPPRNKWASTCTPTK